MKIVKYATAHACAVDEMTPSQKRKGGWELSSRLDEGCEEY